MYYVAGIVAAHFAEEPYAEAARNAVENYRVAVELHCVAVLLDAIRNGSSYCFAVLAAEYTPVAAVALYVAGHYCRRGAVCCSSYPG